MHDTKLYLGNIEMECLPKHGSSWMHYSLTKAKSQNRAKMPSYDQKKSRNGLGDPLNHTLDTDIVFGPFEPLWAFFGPKLGPKIPVSED